MKNPSGRPWSRDEEFLLMERGLKRLSVKELAELTGRTVVAVRVKRNVLLNPAKYASRRARYNESYYALHRAGKMKSLTGTRWTAEEIRMITKDEQPNDVLLSNQLNRSVQAIQVMRSKCRAEGLQVI